MKCAVCLQLFHEWNISHNKKLEEAWLEEMRGSEAVTVLNGLATCVEHFDDIVRFQDELAYQKTGTGQGFFNGLMYRVRMREGKDQPEQYT